MRKVPCPFRTWTFTVLLVSVAVLGGTCWIGRGFRKVCALLFFSTMKKIFTLILLSMIAFNAIHAEIKWTLLQDGTLIISGSGSMPNDCRGLYWYSQRGKIKKVIIENGVTTLGGDAFVECSRLTSITIPNSVTSIGIEVFRGCSSLTSRTIPNSVTSIGDYTFYGCI